MDTVLHSKIKSMSSQLLVTDINRSIAFYTKKLGFAIDFCYEDFYCGISKAGYSIHLKLSDSVKEVNTYRKNHEHLAITLSIEDMESLHQNMENNAATIIQPLRTMPYGREFYPADPDDNIIALLETA